jgi:hypothetical protein
VHICRFSRASTIVSNIWVHQTRFITAGSGTKWSEQIGFSKKKALRLIMILRSTTFIDTCTDCGLQGRAYAQISKISVKYAGKTYQSSSGLEIDDDASTPNFLVARAEMMKNGGGLLDMSTNSILKTEFSINGDAATHPVLTENCGSFYYELSFSNSADTEVSSSGLQINRNNLEILVEKAASTNALTVDFFLEFENSYIMDVNERVWSVDDTLRYQN